MYFNTTEKKTKIYSNTAWSDLGGGWDGVLPNYTSTQKDALSPAVGQQIYNTTENKVQVYGQGAWKTVTAKLSVGATCSLDGDCDSAHCADGVCCGTSCTGGCEVCNLAGTIGTCTIRAADNTTESPPACQRCDGTNGSFQLQTVDNGYLCTGNCTYCVSGSCINYSNGSTCEGASGGCATCTNGTCGNLAQGSQTAYCTGCYYCNGGGACYYCRWTFVSTGSYGGGTTTYPCNPSRAGLFGLQANTSYSEHCGAISTFYTGSYTGAKVLCTCN